MFFASNGNRWSDAVRICDAILVGFQLGVCEQIFVPKALTEALPVIVAGDADEYLITLFCLEAFVHTPCALSRGHGGHRFFQKRSARHVLHHQQRYRFIKRTFYHLSLSCSVSITKRTKDTNYAVGAAHNINDGRAGP